MIFAHIHLTFLIPCVAVLLVMAAVGLSLRRESATPPRPPRQDLWVREKPISEEELKRARNSAVAVSGITKFTCDGCNLRFTCMLAFDPYNTDGDCLLDK